MAKLIDQIDSSGLFAQSAYSAAVATNDDLGRKISTTYLTAVDLSPYATTSQLNTVSSTLSGAIPTLSAGEGIEITTNDGKTIITNNISAGTNISLVYDQETNKIRIDSEGGGIDWTTGADLSAIVQTSSNDSNYQYEVMLGKNPYNTGLLVSADGFVNRNAAVSPGEISVFDTTQPGQSYPSWRKSVLDYTKCSFSSVESAANSSYITSSTYALTYTGLNHSRTYSSIYGPQTTSSVTWTWNDINYIQNNSANLGKTYTGISPIVVNNTTNQISADTWSFSAGYGLVFTDDNVNKVTKLEVEGESLSAGPNIDIFSSGGYVVISATGGDAFPMTGTDGTANFTANANFSSFTLTTGQGAAGAHVNMNVKGVHYEAYPSTDVSSTWKKIVDKSNEEAPTTYCYVYPSGYGELDLDTMTAYNKVTVFAPGDYGPDRMLYGTDDNLNHSYKVMPSGLWVEAIKNRKEGGQFSWSLINSGWISYNNMWEGD